MILVSAVQRDALLLNLRFLLTRALISFPKSTYGPCSLIAIPMVGKPSTP